MYCIGIVLLSGKVKRSVEREPGLVSWISYESIFTTFATGDFSNVLNPVLD